MSHGIEEEPRLREVSRGGGGRLRVGGICRDWNRGKKKNSNQRRPEGQPTLRENWAAVHCRKMTHETNDWRCRSRDEAQMLVKQIRAPIIQVSMCIWTCSTVIQKWRKTTLIHSSYSLTATHCCLFLGPQREYHLLFFFFFKSMSHLQFRYREAALIQLNCSLT